VQRYEIEKFLKYNQPQDTVSYEVVASETDLAKALKKFDNFIHNNPSFVYRLVLVVVDEVKTTEPEG